MIVFYSMFQSINLYSKQSPPDFPFNLLCFTSLLPYFTLNSSIVPVPDIFLNYLRLLFHFIEEYLHQNQNVLRESFHQTLSGFRCLISPFYSLVALSFVPIFLLQFFSLNKNSEFIEKLSMNRN